MIGCRTEQENRFKDLLWDYDNSINVDKVLELVYKVYGELIIYYRKQEI
jgi:hypothetical protein